MYKANVISVIVPIHNTEKYLQQCVESILNQTHTELEVILVDDRSTDQCPAICDRFAEADDRVKVIHTQAGSAGAARNAGLDIAGGEYIGFVDSDDWIEPDMYEKLLTAMQKKNAQCAMCRTRFHYPSGEITEASFPDRKEELTPIDLLIDNCASIHGERIVNGGAPCVWDKLYFHGIWQDLYFDTFLNVAEDRDIILQLAQKVDRVALADTVGYNYRKFIGISRDGRKNNECTYIVGYRIFDWAVKNHIEHSFYLDTVVIHSLGRVRASAIYRNKDRYFDTHRDFKRNWKMLKKTLPGSPIKIQVLSYALRFTPHILWAALSVVCKFRDI